MKSINSFEHKVFEHSLRNAKEIFKHSNDISCEGLRYEVRFLAAWIAIHLRRLIEDDFSGWHKKESLKQSSYLSHEILRCLSFVHESGYLSALDYLMLKDSYRWIHAQICQWEQRSVARRWLGRFIRLYHGEKIEKGGYGYEKNDRFSFNGCNGIDEFAGVCRDRIRN